MSTFYTSDTHLGHARILELCNRPFASVERMNAEMVRIWNSVVQPNDIVFHLGDAALGKIAESLPLFEQMNGYKYLVPGNHDRVSSMYEDRRPAFRGRFMEEYAKYFAILPEVYEHEISGHKVLLSHYPYKGDSQDNDRHIEARPADTGLPLIHGHIHNTNRDGFIKDNMFHVGVDVHAFEPVPESRILEWIESL